MKKKVKYLMGLVLAGIASIAGMSYILYDRNHFVTTRYQIQSKNIKSNLRIILLADLHNQSYGADNDRLVSAIKKERPDLILFSGDMIDNKAKPEDYSNFITLCRRLIQTCPIHYCYGNHELTNKNIKEMEKTLKEIGVEIVNNESYRIIINRNKIRILGLVHEANASDALVKKKKAYLNSALFDKSSYKIMLYHYPERVVNTIPDIPVDLILSGHAHGGQWRFGNRGLYAPGQGLFPKFTSGLYKLENAHFIISRGIGSHVWLPRINNPAEIVVIDISPEE